MYEDQKSTEKDCSGRCFKQSCISAGFPECELSMCMGLSSAGIPGRSQ